GNGGVVTINSTATKFFGNISARGGENGGNGGFVEVSGKYLLFEGNVDTRAPRGIAGNLLIDPDYVTVDTATTDDTQLDDNTIDGVDGGNGTTYYISASKVVTQLSSSSVSITANTSITINSAIASSSANSLTLTTQTLNLNANMSTSDGYVTFNANVVLGSTVTVSTSSANVTFAGTINGAYGLTVNSTGATTFNGIIGGSTPLTSLTTDSGGTTTFNSNTITFSTTTQTVTTGTTTTTTNLAQGQTVVASSEESASFLASYAVDGSTSTRWASARATPSYIYVDLGQNYNVNQVNLIFEAGNNANAIQTSTDASSWTTQATVDAPNFSTQTINLSATARYVRMYTTGSFYGTAGVSLYEFQVYDSNGTTQNITTGTTTTVNVISTSTSAGTSTSVTTSGAQTFNDAITLGANSTLTSNSSGVIALNSTVDGAYTFAVNTSGATTFAGIIGGTTALTSLTTNSGGTTTISTTAITTSSAQTFNDAVTVSANATLTASTFAINNTFTANSGVTLEPYSASATIGLGTGSTGTFNLNTTTLANISSTATVTVGASSNSNAVDINTANLSATNYNLTINSGATTFSGLLTLASGKTLQIISSADLTDNNSTNTDVSISSGYVLFDFANAIGTSSNPIELAVGTLAARTRTSGGIFIRNSGGLVIDTVGGVVGVTSASGDIDIRTSSPLRVSRGVRSNFGNINLNAQGSTTNDNLTIEANIEAVGSDSSVTLTAGHNIVQTSASRISAPSLAAISFSAGLGTGTGSVTLSGSVVASAGPINFSASGSITLNAGADVKTTSGSITLTAGDSISLAANSALSASGGAISLTAQTGTLDISTPLDGTPLNFNAVTMNVNAKLTGAVMNLTATTMNLFAAVTSSDALKLNATTINVNATVTGNTVVTNADTFNLNAPLNCASLNSDADTTNINGSVSCNGASFIAHSLNINAPVTAGLVTTNADIFNLNAPLNCGSLNSDADTTNINDQVTCFGAKFKAKTLNVNGPIGTEFLTLDAEEVNVSADINTTTWDVEIKTLNAGEGHIAVLMGHSNIGQQTGFIVLTRKFSDKPGADQPFDVTIPEFSGSSDVQILSNPDNPVNNSPLTLNILPANLPPGNQLITGTVIGNQKSFVGNIAETSFSMLFNPPPAVPGTVFDVLYWNPLLRNGIGDWEKISNVSTLPSGAISATVQAQGTYVLVQRMNTDSSALAVRVNSGQQIPIGNAPAPVISLNLPQGNQVLVTRGVADNATIRNENARSLPGPLPGGATLTSAMTIDANRQNAPLTLIPASEKMQLTFNITRNGNYAVLYWNSLLNRGQGGWVQVTNAQITADGNIMVDAAYTGTFALVSR
ncbi:MAG: discoidin domain-containing protein, partial [Chloroflexi bacterium]|nr:discoidin domain-containing protein [Chloroflexota bacterium]